MREQDANQGSRTGDRGVDRRLVRWRHQTWISFVVGCRSGSPDLLAPAPAVAAAPDSGTVMPGNPPGRGDQEIWRGWCALRPGTSVDEKEQVDVGEEPVAALPSAAVERIEEEDVGHGSSRI